MSSTSESGGGGGGDGGAPDSRQDSRQQEEEIRRKLINDIGLTRAPSTMTGKGWKFPSIYISTMAEHRESFYCIDCKKWCKGRQSANVKQHCERSHKDAWPAFVAATMEGREGSSDRGGSAAGSSQASTLSSRESTQRTLTQSKITSMDGEPLYRLHRSLTGFLVRDMRPFNLIEGEGFIR